MAKQIITKTCRVCKQTKPIFEFHERKDSPDGHRNDCKNCHNQYNKKYQQTESGQERTKCAIQKFRGTEKYPLQRSCYQEKYRKANLVKFAAKSAVVRAIKEGKLPPVKTLQCSCGKQAKQYHHWHGYAPAHHLDVVPVCVPCHGETRKIS